MQRAIDYKENTLTENSTDEYREGRSSFSKNVGANIKDYTNFALDYTNQGSISNITNVNTKNLVTSVPSVFNQSNTVVANNTEFIGLDKENGDNFAPAIILGLVSLSSYLNAPKDEEEIKSGPTDAAYLIPGTAIPKALSTLGLKTVAKGSAVTLGISTGIDLTAQGINKIVTGEDINYDNLKTTAIMSLTGNAAANVVNNGKNISTAARVLYGLGTDTAVSASSQYLKYGKVEAENTFVDVVVGKSFEKIGSTAGMLYKKTTKSIKHIDNKIIPTLKKQSNAKSKTIHERNMVRAKINKTEQKKQNVITNSGFKTGALVNNSGTTIANSIADSDDKKEDPNDK